MQVDLLDLNNYILVNKTLISIFGLKAATYCAELFTIVKKAVSKNKVVEDNYISVDRDYIEATIGVDTEEQKRFETVWESLDLLAKHPTKEATFTLNVSGFVALISATKPLSKAELKKIKTRLKPQPKVSKEEKIKNVTWGLKMSFTHPNNNIKKKLDEWIDEICYNTQFPLSKPIVKSFIETLDKYTSNEEIAIAIIQSAINNSYRDCNWAINSYERNIGNRPRATSQPKASIDDVDTGEAF